MRKLLFIGARADFYLVCSEINGEFIAYYVDYKTRDYCGQACKYKRFGYVLKFAKKYHFSLYFEKE